MTLEPDSLRAELSMRDNLTLMQIGAMCNELVAERNGKPTDEIVAADNLLTALAGKLGKRTAKVTVRNAHTHELIQQNAITEGGAGWAISFDAPAGRTGIVVEVEYY